jgi:hypothetical protein
VNPRWEDTPRGRPCPAMVDGLRCCGSSEVLNVRHLDDRTVRYRRCITCGHRWRTSERDDDLASAAWSASARSDDTGSTSFLAPPLYTRPKTRALRCLDDASTPPLPF